MADAYDLVIRRGTIVDGSGGAQFKADVAIIGSEIAAVGSDLGPGTQEIDARGKLVTPGFIDVHTHYDGQVTWEDRLVPSSAHGVTTVVIGNCGVGFAPCREEQRDTLLKLMEGVEDIPNIVLSEGVPWKWESFPEFLDFLDQRQFDADVAAYVPHAALRTYVMGERALAQEAATSKDISDMGALLTDAVKAGAIGLGTSQVLFHRSSDGGYTPTLAADETEYSGLAKALQSAGGGVMQFVMEWAGDWEPRFEMLHRLAMNFGLPITYALTQTHVDSEVWKGVLDATSEALEDGSNMSIQVLPRPIGVLLGLELTLNPFYTTETYERLAKLPLEERVAEMRNPEVRKQILSESNNPTPLQLIGMRVRDFSQLYELSDVPDYEPDPSTSIGAQAEAMGVAPESLAYDRLLDREGRNILYLAFSNYADFSLEPTRAMLTHPASLPGLGDGGAHLGTICDASIYTYLLTYWARDRKLGERIPIEQVVRKATRAGAEMAGLRDRGLLRPGYRADINVIDFDKLSLGLPRIVRDLPAGGRRLMQDASGYDATIVAGEIVRRNGEDLGARPGRLIRGGRADPTGTIEETA